MDKISKLLKTKPKVVNMGLKSFYEAQKDQKNPAVHMDWRPPAGGKKKFLEILKKLR